jgi:hypothetical protein
VIPIDPLSSRVHKCAQSSGLCEFALLWRIACEQPLCRYFKSTMVYACRGCQKEFCRRCDHVPSVILGLFIECIGSSERMHEWSIMYVLIYSHQA